MNHGPSWRSWIFSDQPEQEVDEELRFHLEQRTRDYIAQGMSPDSAHRAATQRFGDVEPVRDACASLLAADRAAEHRRTLARLSWLDMKLGLRMLAKYPGLSIVSVVGMALAIAIGAGYFAVLGAMLDATLPFDQDARVVMIRNRAVAGPDTGDVTDPSAQDFVQWRDELASVEAVGAFRDDSRNVIAKGGKARLVRVAAMTASGFRSTRVAPMLGRTLLDEDEHPGAPPVVVVGYDEWRTRFDSDARILGTTVRLDDTVHTIVGVMPEGFAFPGQHRYWVPLSTMEIAGIADGEPSFHVFGRLADGSSLTDARAELAAIGERMAAAFPQSHRNIRPHVLPYMQGLIGINGPEMELAVRTARFGVGLLLLIIAVNVAILVYARTATRTGEIAVRTALGASRGRVVAQLFVEALVLSVAAAAAGLTILTIAFRVLRESLMNSPDPSDRIPFWVQSFGVTPGVIVYVAGLAVIAAVIVGVLPALQATGQRMQARLQQFSSRSDGMQLGRTWTALIVVQVAIAVAALPAAMHYAEEMLRVGTRRPAAAANDLLRGTLEMSREARGQTWPARYTERMEALMQRLAIEPGVSAVTFAERFPGEDRYASIEGDGHGAAIGAGSNHIATNLFEVFEVHVLTGRGFVAADTRPGANAVIVDQTLADRLERGGRVVGRRIRYLRRTKDGAAEPGPWYEIVGVVPAFANTFTAPNSFERPLPRIYHATTPDQAYPASLVVKVRGGAPARFASRLQEVTAAVDPTLKVDRATSVVESWDFDMRAMWLTALAIIAVTLSVLLLSAGGIYAMMSFTVARRRREIGIRAALGADARRVLIGIFGRASAQLAAGIALGLIVAVTLERAGGDMMGGKGLILLPTVVAVMFAVGLLAALGPARRGLAIQPTEALRDE